MAEGKVRIATEGDANALAAIYAPFVTDTVISFEVTPPDEADMAARIAKVLPHFPWLVLEEQGTVLGYAYACAHRERAAYRWSADVGTYVAARVHRRGVGRTLYSALLPVLRQQGFHMAHAGITLPNDASIGLHEAFGFTRIGLYREVGFKHGAWRDVGWWGLPLSTPAAEPPDPRPFTAEIFERATGAACD